MTPRAKAIRIVLGAIVAVLLVAGTWKGDDDNFPFGPFRMYSTKQELDGEVRAIELYGYRAGGWEKVLINDFGLRRADLEGQLGKLAEPPEWVLEQMYRAHDRNNPGPVPFDALQLRLRTHDLEDGKPAEQTVEIVGTWWAP